jgi:DNA-binding response OmpR family regulator
MTIPSALHILVVEDNDGLREATVDYLRAQGHQVTGLVCAEDVDDTPTRGVPDIYLIDVNLPGENGFSLADRLRRTQPMAGIVLLTARGQLSDRLEGYSSGVDNYLIKPVEQMELLACIQNLARRIKPVQASADLLELNSLSLCLNGPLGSEGVTHGESMLLAGFIRAAGQKLERWQAMQLVDPTEKGLSTANLEMRITQLRRKLSACGAPDDAIRTLRGFGYALSCSIRLT